MNSEDYNSIVEYVQKICGIVLGPDKRYLVEQRLSPLLADFGCADLGDFAALLRRGGAYTLREKVLNAITTNETSFFRDEHPFSAFKEKLFPELMAKVAERKARPWQRRGPKAMIWSAACSTGQEAYSLAMAIHDGVAYGGRGDIGADDFGILASDISSRVLAKAMLGRYNALEVARGLSPELRNRYMAAEQGEYVIQEKIRQMVEFRTVNLQEPFTHVGAFDIIFCRNILIYFSEMAKQQILRQMLQMLSPGGVLMLGSAENMYGLDLGYVSESYGSTVYYRKNA